MLNLTLPLPNPLLFCNRTHGKHWAVTYEPKKQDREIGDYYTKKALSETGNVFTKQDRLIRTMRIIFGDKRRRDDDNILGAFKAMQDGIFSALGIDDSQIDLTILDKRVKDKANPRVELTLRVLALSNESDIVLKL